MANAKHFLLRSGETGAFVADAHRVRRYTTRRELARRFKSLRDAERAIEDYEFVEIVE